MIVIDKNIPTQSIIVTASESIVANDLRIKVYSTYTNKTFYLILEPNLSPYPNRYDEYSIAVADIATWDSGVYQYQLQDYNSNTDTVNKTVEVGLMKVKSNTVSTFISIPQAEPENDFIVWNPNI